MKKTQNIEDWIQKFQLHFRHYTGELVLDFGLTIKDTGVYIFLISQKWHTKKIQFSPYEIYRKLNSLPSDFAKKSFKTNFTEKTVLESLNNLEELSFVKKCLNSNKSNSGGRPAKSLYEASLISDLKNHTQTRLDATKSHMLNLIEELLYTEESIGLEQENYK